MILACLTGLFSPLAACLFLLICFVLLLLFLCCFCRVLRRGIKAAIQWNRLRKTNHSLPCSLYVKPLAPRDSLVTSLLNNQLLYQGDVLCNLDKTDMYFLKRLVEPYVKKPQKTSGLRARFISLFLYIFPDFIYLFFVVLFWGWVFIWSKTTEHCQ